MMFEVNPVIDWGYLCQRYMNTRHKSWALTLGNESSDLAHKAAVVIRARQNVHKHTHESIRLQQIFDIAKKEPLEELGWNSATRRHGQTALAMLKILRSAQELSPSCKSERLFQSWLLSSILSSQNLDILSNVHEFFIQTDSKDKQIFHCKGCLQILYSWNDWLR